MSIEELISDNQRVLIEAGELVSYKVDDHEFIHQKGRPGWRNSDTEMFPIIGPTSGSNFKVETPKSIAIQDQHGLLRELSYNLISTSSNFSVYQKKYRANTSVSNSKFPEKSTAKELQWPYHFVFRKSFSLSEDGLEISFRIDGDEGMPFMLGYHPAFKLYTENPTIEGNERVVSLEEVLAVGNRAYHVANCQNIMLKDDKNLSIKTEGFGNFMLWSEVPNMVCIEPITFYPYAVEANQLHTGFEILGKAPKIFKVLLSIVKN